MSKSREEAKYRAHAVWYAKIKAKRMGELLGRCQDVVSSPQSYSKEDALSLLEAFEGFRADEMDTAIRKLRKSLGITDDPE